MGSRRESRHGRKATPRDSAVFLWRCLGVIMTCEGCLDPALGLYVAGCRECSLRAIALGPEFYASMRAAVITPAYAARLIAFGAVADVHAEVKAIAKRTVVGSVRA